MTAPSTSFADIVAQRAATAGGGIIFEHTEWSWAQVVAEGQARARLLDTYRRGGEQLHVGVLLENIPDFGFWLTGAALSGDVIVGLNPTRRGTQMAADIAHADCDLLVYEDRTADLLDGIELPLPPSRRFNVDSLAYGAALKQAAVGPHRSRTPAPTDTLLLLFSSGSTGTPKAVICSQGRLAALAGALAQRFRLTAASVTYLSMPMFHGNALMANLAPAMVAGATVVLRRKFSASGFVADIRTHQVTFWNYVGRALAYVLATPEAETDRDNRLELAFGTEAGATNMAEFARRFGTEVMEGYGATEGVLRINRTPDSPADSLGVPVGERVMEIVNEATGQVCPPAEFGPDGQFRNAAEAVGQMVVRGGAAAFEGYYNNPAAMAERVRGDDFWTGDLAYRDEEGFVYFAGRTADWLRVDGENLAAAPIERLLDRYEPVNAAVVYGVPDPQTGDSLMVSLELAPGASFDPEHFMAFLHAQPDLGTKWVPKFVRVTRELPMTGNGKIARAVLREQGWLVGDTSDPVWMWERDGGYRLMRQAERDDLLQVYAEHGRAHLLGLTG